MISFSLQIASGICAAAGVITNNYITSRLCRGSALATIAGDYAFKYTIHPAPAYLIGMATFAIPAVRTFLIIAVPRLDQDWNARAALCASAATLQLSLIIPTLLAHFEWLLILPLLVICLAAAGDTSNNMPVRRRYILAIGLIASVFAIATNAWGLLAKALIADFGASALALKLTRRVNHPSDLAR